mgnify:CR=1 FL=1
MVWAERIEALCALSLLLCMMSSFATYGFAGMLYNPVLAALGITIANLNKGRVLFYYIVLLGFSLLFDFIQMLNSGAAVAYEGSTLFGLLLMICNLVLKGLIMYSANKQFISLGGTWAFSASFNTGGGEGDNTYANMAADQGSGVDYNAGSSYQDESGYRNPPVATSGSNGGTTHL